MGNNNLTKLINKFKQIDLVSHCHRIFTPK